MVYCENMSVEGTQSLVVEALKDASQGMNRYPNTPMQYGISEHLLAVLAQMLLPIEKHLQLLEKAANKEPAY